MTNNVLTLEQLQKMIKNRKEAPKKVLQQNILKTMTQEEIRKEIEKRLFK